MRLTLAVLIWLVFVGGLGIYTHYRDATVRAARPIVEIQTVEGNYAIEITTTFAVEPDPFAVQTDELGQQPALVVRLGQREILKITDRLAAGTPIRIEPLLGLVEGTNETYLEASSRLEQVGESQAVRVQILRDGQTIAEQTFWSLPGGKVAETMRFELAIAKEAEEDHDA